MGLGGAVTVNRKSDFVLELSDVLMGRQLLEIRIARSEAGLPIVLGEQTEQHIVRVSSVGVRAGRDVQAMRVQIRNVEAMLPVHMVLEAPARHAPHTQHVDDLLGVVEQQAIAQVIELAGTLALNLRADRLIDCRR
jgi:hypothetical protein